MWDCCPLCALVGCRALTDGFPVRLAFGIGKFVSVWNALLCDFSVGFYGTLLDKQDWNAQQIVECRLARHWPENAPLNSDYFRAALFVVEKMVEIFVPS